MKITFTEGSGLADSIFGKVQAPIRMFIEKRGEAFEQNSLLSEIFLMEDADSYGDLLTSMTSMGGFQPVGENGDYPEDGMQEGYSKLLVYETWKDSFAISWEAAMDGKILDMKKQPAAFMTAYGRTRERFGAALFGGAIAGQTSVKFNGKKFDITSADGAALFATNHKPKVKGDKQCNRFSNAFSADALSMAESAMHLFKGDDDNELDVAPTTIMVPSIASLVKDVFAVIGADKDPATANNAFNYQFGRWRVLVNPYLNRYVTPGTKPWILLDSDYNQTYGGAVWRDRVKLEVESTIAENDANKWKGKSRFNATFHDFRFACVGGMADGTDLTTLNV